MSVHGLPDMSSFIEYLRPVALRTILDKAAGISPQQREQMDKVEAKRWRRVSDLAVQACGKLTDAEYEALAEYLTRDC